MKLLQQAINQYQTNMVGQMFPPCFGSASQWKEWLALEEDAKTEPRKFACRDCTEQFQSRAMRNGTCLIPEIPVEYVTRQRD